MAKKSKYYLNNKELIKELVSYKETGIVSEELGIMFMQIANGMSKKSNFAGYTWLDDMKSEAILTCIKSSRSFNEEKSNNAFAYISQICYNAFIGYLNKQKKHSDIKDICFRYQQEISDVNLVDDKKFEGLKDSIDYTILEDYKKQELKLINEEEEIESIINNLSDENNE